MNDIVQFYTAALPRGPHHETRLLEEIAFLEVRVRELNLRADCAYEKSLARSYAALLEARRAELRKLDTH
jgi:hypothetical protein